jgi:O-antigen ligase
VSILGLLLSIFSVAGATASVAVSRRLLILAAICTTVVLAQAITGKILFFGDAWMVELYIGIWITAVLAGRLIATTSVGNSLLDALMSACIFAAVISVGIALVQWTGTTKLFIYAAELRPGGRPFANLAQPNHFCTLCFLGLCALFWLHQFEKISNSTFILAGVFLLLGMVASQSRTGWLQIGLLVTWVWINHARVNLRVSKSVLLSLGAGYAAGVFFWPSICNDLLLSLGRPVADQLQAGVRLPFWWSMLDAIFREPLFGYGWQQIGAAQERVAFDHPPMGALFDHSHNFVLDMLLWNGLPIGGLLLAILAWWFMTHIRACRDARIVWLLAVAGGILTHGMLEYPLTYAYFLIPTGLAMGAVEGLSTANGLEVRILRPVLITFVVVLSILFSVIAVEYFKTEEQYRSFRFELARIGSKPPVVSATERHLLTQLQAIMEYYRTEAEPGMSPEKLDWMRKVSERYGFSSVLFRYAVAAGLNGRPEVAQTALAQICRIHAPLRCKEFRENWIALGGRYPQLMDIKLPEVETP